MVTVAEMKYVIFGSVVVVTALVGVVVLAANPRRTWNQWLAFFLLLICGNFVTQLMIPLQHVLDPAGALDAARNTRWSHLWESVGFVLQTFDVAALAYFASVFPRRGGLLDRRWGLPLLAGAVLAFLAMQLGGRLLSTPMTGITAPRALFFAYLVLGYGYAARRLTSNYLAEPSSVMAEQVRIVALGALVATLPRIALVADDLGFNVGLLLGVLDGSDDGGRAFYATNLVVRSAVLVALWAGLRRLVASGALPAERRQGAAQLLHWAGLVFALFLALWWIERSLQLLTVGQPGVPAWVLSLRDALNLLPFAIRWVAFSALMVYGIVRFQVMAVHLGALAKAAIAAAGVVLFLAVGAVATVLGPWAAATLAAVALLGVFVAAQAVAARPVAQEAYLRERRLEVYKATLAAAVAEGPLDDVRLAELAGARGRLGVSQREHETLLAIAQAEEAGGERPVLLGRYEVLRRLGAGGYATVYLARDREAGGLVALKRLRQDFAGTRRAAEAALRELQVARRVSHPNIVAIHDLVRLDDGAVVVMEFLEGGSLRDHLRRRARMPPGEVAAMARQVLAGLGALHEAGIVHGDVKPENVLFGAGGAVKLADFGTARGAHEHRTLVHAATGSAPGTFLYMAPEQAAGGRPTARSDLYALGAVCVEALSGRSHIDGSAKGPYEILQAVVEGRGQPLAGGRVPEAWRAFLAQALAVEPAKRFRSAAEMREGLAALEEPSPGQPTPRLPVWRTWRSEA